MTTSVESLPDTARESPFPWGALLVLATAVFMSVTAEMLPTGLLPEMSAELRVPEAQIGLLVTLFAFAVVVTSVPLVALTKRLSRHTLVVAVLVTVALTSLLSAFAPSYPVLAVARVLGGMAHGLFWAVVGVYSVHLVPRRHIARAVAITTGGGTLAFVLGVPLATVVGQAFGWRVPFAAISILAAAAAVLILRRLPRVPNTQKTARDARPAGLRGRARIEASVPAVALLCLIIATLMIGHYALYTYITPYMIGMLSVPPSAVGGWLFLFGAAGAVGLALAGFVFAKHPSMGVCIGVVASVVTVTALAVFSSNPVVVLVAFVVWGAGMGMIPPLMQARLLHIASPSVRDTANAFFSSAFNVGIALGALVGGLVLTSSGLSALPVVYIVMFGVGGVLLLASVLSASAARRRTALA